MLLVEERDLHNTALYQGVLSAVAAGHRTRGGIANYVGRKSTDLGHALTVLEDAGLIAPSRTRSMAGGRPTASASRS